MNIDSVKLVPPTSTVRGSFVRHEAGGVKIVVSLSIRNGVDEVVDGLEVVAADDEEVVVMSVVEDELVKVNEGIEEVVDANGVLARPNTAFEELKLAKATEDIVADGKEGHRRFQTW